jgi:hypothetical protein
MYSTLIVSFFFVFSVHLVELQGSGELFAMKAMDKSVMMNRNKVISIDWSNPCKRNEGET